MSEPEEEEKMSILSLAMDPPGPLSDSRSMKPTRADEERDPKAAAKISSSTFVPGAVAVSVVGSRSEPDALRGIHTNNDEEEGKAGALFGSGAAKDDEAAARKQERESFTEPPGQRLPLLEDFPSESGSDDDVALTAAGGNINNNILSEPGALTHTRAEEDRKAKAAAKMTRSTLAPGAATVSVMGNQSEPGALRVTRSNREGAEVPVAAKMGNQSEPGSLTRTRAEEDRKAKAAAKMARSTVVPGAVAVSVVGNRLEPSALRVVHSNEEGAEPPTAATRRNPSEPGSLTKNRAQEDRKAKDAARRTSTFVSGAVAVTATASEPHIAAGAVSVQAGSLTKTRAEEDRKAKDAARRTSTFVPGAGAVTATASEPHIVPGAVSVQAGSLTKTRAEEDRKAKDAARRTSTFVPGAGAVTANASEPHIVPGAVSVQGGAAPVHKTGLRGSGTFAPTRRGTEMSGSSMTNASEPHIVPGAVSVQGGAAPVRKAGLSGSGMIAPTRRGTEMSGSSMTNASEPHIVPGAVSVQGGAAPVRKAGLRGSGTFAPTRRGTEMSGSSMSGSAYSNSSDGQAAARRGRRPGSSQSPPRAEGAPGGEPISNTIPAPRDSDMSDSALDMSASRNNSPRASRNHSPLTDSAIRRGLRRSNTEKDEKAAARRSRQQGNPAAPGVVAVSGGALASSDMSESGQDMAESAHSRRSDAPTRHGLNRTEDEMQAKAAARLPMTGDIGMSGSGHRRKSGMSGSGHSARGLRRNEEEKAAKAAARGITQGQSSSAPGVVQEKTQSGSGHRPKSGMSGSGQSSLGLRRNEEEWVAKAAARDITQGQSSSTPGVVQENTRTSRSAAIRAKLDNHFGPVDENLGSQVGPEEEDMDPSILKIVSFRSHESNQSDKEDPPSGTLEAGFEGGAAHCHSPSQMESHKTLSGEPGILEAAFEGGAIQSNNASQLESQKPIEDTWSNRAHEHQAELITAELVDEDGITDDIRNKLMDEAVLASEVVEVKEKTCWQKYRIACCVVTIVAVVAIVLGVTLSKGNDEAELTGYDYLLELVSSISGEDALLDQSTAQYKALNWLAVEDEAMIPQNSTNADILTDRYVIALMYFAMNGPGWPNQLTFLSNTSVCEWPPLSEDEELETDALVGIRCDVDERVNHIRLDQNNLTGTVLSELSAIKSLGLLSFRDNALTGPIPPSLGGLPGLELLAFPENALTGTIPESLSHLQTLKLLVLFDNALTGTIPSDLTKIDFDELHLGENNLTGTIPDFLPRSGMSVLSLDQTLLSGTIPETLFTLRAMERLYIYSTMITGTLSTKIGSLGKLSHLLLHDNRLSGTIPSQITNADDLQILGLGSNAFDGTIPTEFARLVELQELNLGYNHLSGTVPTELSEAYSLWLLQLEGNMLTGTIPVDLVALQDLSYGSIHLHNNSFNGSLDSVFCNETLFDFPAILSADCNELQCSCCTDCWDDATGEVILQMDQVCLGYSRDYEWYGEEVGTYCQCSDDGFDISCADMSCQICNEDGSQCLENFDYGHNFTEDGSDHRWHCNMRFVSGRSEEISWKSDFLEDECTVSINGTKCNSCEGKICSDGFPGNSVDCSNIEEGAIYDDCDASLNGGDLLWFLAPEHFMTDCYPRIHHGWLTDY